MVGAGSAGCVLAARLSEDPSVSVALLEAGGNNDGVLNRVPTGAAVHIIGRNAHNWAFSTVPQPGFAGRRGYQPRGRGLGGSSSINAMLYVRGHARTTTTGAGWHRRLGLEDVLPFFDGGEQRARSRRRFHGRGGPLNVADQRRPIRLHEASSRPPSRLAAAQRRLRGVEQDGVGCIR